MTKNTIMITTWVVTQTIFNLATYLGIVFLIKNSINFWLQNYMVQFIACRLWKWLTDSSWNGLISKRQLCGWNMRTLWIPLHTKTQSPEPNHLIPEFPNVKMFVRAILQFTNFCTWNWVNCDKIKLKLSKISIFFLYLATVSLFL